MLVRAGFVAACLVNAAAVYWPSQPGPAVSVAGADKVAHLVLFGLVAWLGCGVGIRPRLLAVVLLLHAVSSELVQGLALPHRSGDWRDVVADLVGTAAGLAVAARRPRPIRAGGRQGGS